MSPSDPGCHAPDAFPIGHRHVECPFCESTIVCVLYTLPTPKLNGESTPLTSVSDRAELLASRHLRVHVEEMITCAT